MNIPAETKIFIGIGAGTIALIVIGVLLFSTPATPVARDRLITKNAHTTGNPTAKTTLVEFSDFQCPACKTYKPVVDEILKANKDNILFVYRNFPLPQHAYGEASARAAEAAAKQGKYWEMHDLLFTRQEDFSDTLWGTLARELQLNTDQFAKDMDSKEIARVISDDAADGKALGISSTPTFFLNGIKLPPMDLGEFKRKVTEAVNKP